MSDALTPDRPIIGVRQWRLDPEQFLCGISANTKRWDAGDNTADGLPTSERQHIGFHAYAPHAESKLTHANDWYYVDEVVVTGVILGWGGVCVHEYGWRSEHARIIAIASFDAHRARWAKHYKNSDKSDEEVAALYPKGADGFTELARRYGVQTVESLSGCVEWAANEGLGTILPRKAHTFAALMSAQKNLTEWQTRVTALTGELEMSKRRAELLA